MAAPLQSIAIQSDPNLAYHFCNIISRGRFVWNDDFFVSEEGNEELYNESINDVVVSNRMLRLSISNNKLTNLHIQHFGTLTSLTHLNIAFNRLIEINMLTSLEQLQFLDISHNKLESLDPIRALLNLKTLRCCWNQITSLEPIAYLLNLEELFLSHNNIGWAEFVYLINHKLLAKIVKYSNPCDEKPKFQEFLLSTCTGLQLLDGNNVQQLRENNTTDFFRTADGRIMLTHAKSSIESSSKFSFANVFQSASRSKSPRITSKAISWKTPTKPSVPSANVSPRGSSTPNSARVRDLYITGNPLNSPVIIYKVPQRPAAVTKENRFNRNKLKSAEKSANKDTKDDDFNQSIDIIQGFTLSQPAPVDLIIPKIDRPATVVRFGQGSDAAIALSVQDDGDGYVRWSRTGPVACSFQKRKMYCTHRTGALALVVESDGSGSLVDSRGRPLLVLSDQGTAKILDAKGLVLKTLHRFPTSGAYALDSDGENGVAIGKKAQHERIAKRKITSWTFDGLHVEFMPKSWEVVVRIHTERLVAQFSSLAGGFLIKEKDHHISEPEPIPEYYSQPSSSLFIDENLLHISRPSSAVRVTTPRPSSPRPVTRESSVDTSLPMTVSMANNNRPDSHLGQLTHLIHYPLTRNTHDDSDFDNDFNYYRNNIKSNNNNNSIITTISDKSPMTQPSERVIVIASVSPERSEMDDELSVNHGAEILDQQSLDEGYFLQSVRDEHESLREGVSSVTSELDYLMQALKGHNNNNNNNNED